MSAYEANLSTPRLASRPQARHGAVAQRPRALLQETWADLATDLARLAGALGVPPDRVEDVLQEVFADAWQKVPPNVGQEEIKWWLIRVTTNRCNLEHRRRKRWLRLLDRLGRLGEGQVSTREEPTLPDMDIDAYIRRQEQSARLATALGFLAELPEADEDREKAEQYLRSTFAIESHQINESYGPRTSKEGA